MGADPWMFDTGLQAALISFQQRHGLHADGIVRGQTLEVLNLSPQTRIAQLQHAMHSWAEQQAADAKQTSAARVWVNIPEASVTAIANNEIALHMRAVVGHPTRPTPTLSSAISRVIVNPSWTVPPSIAGADVLPRQISDPDYLHDNGFRVFAGWRDDQPELDPATVNWGALDDARFPYRLRQNPGPKNSLGRFKFDFPNRHDVYLHDTPVPALLGLSVRSLSAGCVRVESPDALAAWLVGEATDMHEKLATAAADMAYRTRAFKLRAVVPVDLVYLSAWVSANGQVNFRRDIYQLSLPESQRNLFTVAQ
jgi:murein L,D-transpeptidase YcbB/YkuD